MRATLTQRLLRIFCLLNFMLAKLRTLSKLVFAVNEFAMRHPMITILYIFVVLPVGAAYFFETSISCGIFIIFIQTVTTIVLWRALVAIIFGWYFK